MGAVIAVPVAITMQILSAGPTEFQFCIKYIASYLYIEFCKRFTKKRFDWFDLEVTNDPIKTGYISHPEDEKLESPSDDQLSEGSDEVFFHGVNSKSEYIVIRLARSVNHEASAWIYLQLANGKLYHLKETFGFQQSGSDERVFSCGGLKMHYLSPMRRWRVFFNGLLRELNDDQSEEKMVHVKFALTWRVSSDPFDFANDINTGALAVGLAKAKWNSYKPPLEEFQKALDCYIQAGVLSGKATIDGDEHDIYLYGEKLRYLGNISIQKEAEAFHLIGQTQRNGRRVHIVEVSIKNIVEKLRFGFIVQPTGILAPISESDTDTLQNLIKENKGERTYQAEFHAADDLYQVTAKENNQFCSKKGTSHFTVSYIDFKMNSIDGKGFVIKGKVTKPEKRIAPKPVSPPEKSSPLVLHFSDKLCQDSSFTGGKGSSLGKLTELSKDFQNFVVPKGLVVTTVAYEIFVTNEILKQIKHLENVLYGNTKGDIKVKDIEVKTACQRVADEILKTNIPDSIQQSIVLNLKKAFTDEKHIIKFAVRSSATGEDTELLSAAGQMDTFLGVTGLDEILTAVKKCWASQFSFTAVQYKRQYGQIINSPMAVVVQKMIPCDVAGVLFTCDPLTGNPTAMSITANYGLGESVVSGSEEPDTIEIQRHADEKLSIKSKVIGSKRRRIIIKDEGTDTEDVSENEREACCLEDEKALRLGYLAAKIEKSYRSTRDIEWGFWNNNLYIFQSRPVTSGSGETDYEIDHEMDGALRSENEYFSVCNVGEVMPGAMSTLGNEVLKKFFDIIFKRKEFCDWQLSVRAKYHSGGMNTMYSRTMFYALDLLERINVDRAATEAGTIGLYGRIIDDEEMYDAAKERHCKARKKDSWKSHFKRFKRVLYSSKRQLLRSQKDYAKYRVPVEKCATAQELYNLLLESCTDLCQAMASHMSCSEASSLWNIFIFSILRKANGGVIDANVYNDFSILVTTNSDVESADVPSAIERLAFYISKDINPEEFKKMDLSEAVKLLQTSDAESGIKYREFITKHGHRCLKEFDIRSITWGSDPKSLVQLLQNLVGSVNKDRVRTHSEDINELLSRLKIPLTRSSRWFLKLMVPSSRRAVQNREASKSVLIRGVDAWRKGYARIAELMVSEGRIPDADLMYFMTLDELKKLLKTRNPKIISKASHRKKRYPILDKYIFPEITKGFPYPINMEDTSVIVNDDNFSMKGVPVSQGVTKGFIRVALNLEDASHLQPGEILVAYSTDIGWSPYFPILSGVVTELGGLISHGAVVSREYGIPCVAALHGATRQFQTGDYALLDGNKGILQKLPKPEK